MGGWSFFGRNGRFGERLRERLSYGLQSFLARIAFGGEVNEGVGKLDLIRAGGKSADVESYLCSGGGPLRCGDRAKTFELICDGGLGGLGLKCGCDEDGSEEEQGAGVAHAGVDLLEILDDSNRRFSFQEPLNIDQFAV
jgi:hypothetical protein